MRAAEDGRNDETMLPQETSAEQACVQRVHDCHVVETGTTLTARCSRRQVLPLELWARAVGTPNTLTIASRTGS